MKLITKLISSLAFVTAVACNPDLNWQQDTPDCIGVSIDRIILDGAGETRNIDVVADGEFEVHAPAEWITVGTTPKGISVLALPNPGLLYRECTITLSRGSATVDIDVEQPGADLEFSVPHETERVSFTENPLDIEIRSNVSWTPVPRCEWIVADETEYEGNGTLHAVVNRNPFHEDRTGYIYFYNGGQLFYKLRIEQDASPRLVTFSPESFSIEEDGAPFTRQITLSALSPWTVDSSKASWIALSGLPAPDSRTGKYPACSELPITLNGESSTYCRTGTVYFEADGEKYSLTVYQKGIPTELSFDKKDLTGLPMDKTVTTITITSNKRWSIGGNSSWISFDRTSGEAGSTVVSVTAAASSSERFGSFNVICDDVTATIEVSQKMPSFVLDLHFDLKDDSGVYIWPFTVPTDEKPGPTTFITKDGGYEFIIKNTGGIKYQKGYLYMTSAANGDYVKFPIIRGYALAEVYIHSYVGGSGRKLNITDFTDNKIVGPEITFPSKGDCENTWNLEGKTVADHQNGICIVKSATNFYEIKLTYK